MWLLWAIYIMRVVVDMWRCISLCCIRVHILLLDLVVAVETN